VPWRGVRRAPALLAVGVSIMAPWEVIRRNVPVITWCFEPVRARSTGLALAYDVRAATA
jgi:hypothetical protein